MITDFRLYDLRDPLEPIELDNIREINDIYARQYIGKLSARHSQDLPDLEKFDLPLGRYLWCTINLDNKNITLEGINEVLKDICSHKYIQNYYYNYEQRSTTERQRGRGIHNHILFRSEECCSKIKRMIYGKIKKFIGNSRHLDIRKTEYPSDKYNYLLGNKIKGNKGPMIKQDQIFRAENKLKLLYQG